MTLPSHLDAILANDSLDDESSRESKCERIEQLVSARSWPTVLIALLDILSTDRRTRDYQVAAEVIWGAVLDGRPLPANRVIALLYHRFDPSGRAENNLVWSITSKLKGVDYLSEYNPLNDCEIQAELAKIKAR